jgi:hypothetical protein
MDSADEKVAFGPPPTNATETIHEIADTPRSDDKPRLGRVLLIQFLGLLWIVPIVALLALNFRGYIIGSSLECSIQTCVADPNDRDTSQRRSLEDRNILGALQLIAKVLEIWFTAIVGSLVYDLTIYLATTGEGLPIYYLGTHLSLSLSTLFHKSFWTSASPLSRTDQVQNVGKRVTYVFILLVVIALVLSNLMGPATALLLLPTLGWTTVPVRQGDIFSRTFSADLPPKIPAHLCDDEGYPAGNFTCSGYNALGIFYEIFNFQSGTTLLIENQNVSFTFNTSSSGMSIYGPALQSLLHVTKDYNEWAYSLTHSYEEVTHFDHAYPPDFTNLPLYNYNLMRNAQQTQLRRIAPAFSIHSVCYENGISVVRIADNMSIHCYSIPNPDDVYVSTGTVFVPSGTVAPYPISNVSAQLSTKCIRIGSGWPGTNNYSTYTIVNGTSGGPSNIETVATVDLYSSDRAIYLNTTTYPCLTGQNSAGCDWNALFSEDPDPLLRNSTINPQIAQYNLDENPMYCFSTTYLQFPTYVIDTARASNPYVLVSPQDTGALMDGGVLSSTDPIPVHPNWTTRWLQADYDGTVDMDNNAFLLSLLDLKYSDFGSPQTYSLGFTILHNLAAAQSQFQIGYDTIPANKAGLSMLNGTTNPALDSAISVYVWSYGLESRTSSLGAALVIFGCVLVLLKAVVGLLTRAVRRSFLNLIIGALKQPPPQTVQDVSQKPEEDVGKQRFHLENEKWAKYRF